MNRSSSLSLTAALTQPAGRIESEGVEDRLGARVGAALTERSLQADHDISERLRVAREQALARARQRRTAAQTVPASAWVRMGNSLAWRPPAWATRVAWIVPIVTLAAGLLLIDEWYDRAQIHAAAEVDVALLTDDLPVDAYSDPGFAEFLRKPQD